MRLIIWCQKKHDHCSPSRHIPGAPSPSQNFDLLQNLLWNMARWGPAVMFWTTANQLHSNPLRRIQCHFCCLVIDVFKDIGRRFESKIKFHRNPFSIETEFEITQRKLLYACVLIRFHFTSLVIVRLNSKFKKLFLIKTFGHNKNL